MSRSRKHTPICGWCGKSEKSDKRIGNRRLRKRVHEMIHDGEFDNKVFPIIDEVMNKYAMSKDGKGWFGNLKKDYYEKYMRK